MQKGMAVCCLQNIEVTRGLTSFFEASGLLVRKTKNKISVFIELGVTYFYKLWPCVCLQLLPTCLLYGTAGFSPVTFV